MEKFVLRYNSPEITKIMQTLVEKFEVSKMDILLFVEIFDGHAYTNMDAGHPCYNQTTWEIDIEKLLSKIFETAAHFSPAVQDYFFACFDEDAKRKNIHRRGELDYYILSRKIEERRRNSNEQSQGGAAQLPPPAFADLVTEARPLPTLEEVVKDAETFLPNLWKALAAQPKPLVGRAGNVNADAAKPSVLMALAQALLTEQKIDGKKYGQVDVYRMLCRHFGIEPSDRPRIKASTETGYTNAYTDSLSEFNELLKDL